MDRLVELQTYTLGSAQLEILGTTTKINTKTVLKYFSEYITKKKLITAHLHSMNVVCFLEYLQ